MLYFSWTVWNVILQSLNGWECILRLILSVATCLYRVAEFLLQWWDAWEDFLWGSMTCLENWWNLLFFKCPGLWYDNQCCESDRSVLIGLLMQWYCHSPSDTVSRFDWYTLLDTGHWSPIRAAPVNNGKNTSDYHGFVSVNIRSADAE